MGEPRYHPEMGGGPVLPAYPNPLATGDARCPCGAPDRYRPHCLPGCDRLDGHDGRDAGACMAGGTVLVPGPLDLVHRHPDIPVYTPQRAAAGTWTPLPDGSVIGETTVGELEDHLSGIRPLNLPPAAIRPFDLTPPAKILVPRILCRDASYDVRELPLGAGEDAPLIVRTDYGACKAGCCEARVTVQLSVPCDSLPHCHSCECGSDHRFTLGEDVLRELKGFLP